MISVVITLGVVLVGLSFLGRRAEITTPVAKPTQAPPAKSQVRVKLRSSASLNLDESKNVRPDAPEMGPKDLAVFQSKAQARFLALVKEMGFADESRVNGLTVSAEMLMDKMGNEPSWKQLAKESNALALTWPEANQQERQVILDRLSAIYDQGEIELRRRLSDLR